MVKGTEELNYTTLKTKNAALMAENRILYETLRELYNAVEADDGVAWWIMEKAERALSTDGGRAETRGGLSDMVYTAHHYGHAMRTPDGRVLSPQDYTAPSESEPDEHE